MDKKIQKLISELSINDSETIELIKKVYERGYDEGYLDAVA